MVRRAWMLGWALRTTRGSNRSNDSTGAGEKARIPLQIRKGDAARWRWSRGTSYATLAPAAPANQFQP